MRKFSRVIVLVVGLMSVFAAMAGAANASWTNSGATAFTATTGPGTLSAAGVSLTCTSGQASGTAPAGPIAGDYVVTGNLGYSGCRLAGSNATVTCTYTLTGRTRSGSNVVGNVAVSCTVAPFGCRITGTIPGVYTNPSGTTAGRLSVNGSTGLSSSGCILTGAASLAPNPDVFTVTTGTGGTNPNLGPNLSGP